MPLSHRVSGHQVRRVPALPGLPARHLRRALDLPLRGGLDGDHVRGALVGGAAGPVVAPQPSSEVAWLTDSNLYLLTTLTCAYGMLAE